MPTGTILLLGGTGKVAREIAPLLYPTYPIVLASRSGTTPDPARYTGVRFDWDAKSTWGPALSAGPTPVTSIWIVAPSLLHPGHVAKEFIELASEKGALRFVLNSASQVEDGGPATGEIHQYLRELGEEGRVEWAVLRPTWFQENFATLQEHITSIKQEGRIYSATGSGTIPWVSTRDIAAIAMYSLTTTEALNKEFMVLGGELYTYTDLANIFTEVLDREIVYHELTEGDSAQRHRDFGVPGPYADALAAMDTRIKNGAENRLNDLVFNITGKKPRSFEEFAGENKAIWQ